MVYSVYSSDIGTTSGTFLKIPTTGRVIGRGEAFTAQVDDPSALTVNVAGLGNLNNLEILFTHYEWFVDLDYEHLAVAKPVFTGIKGFPGVMGLGITYLHLPSFGQYSDWGEKIGDLNYNDLAFIAGYGQKLYSFNFGVGLKLIRQQVDTISDYAVGSDIGMIYNYKMPRDFLGLRNTYGKFVKLGFTVVNIGFGSGIKGARLPLNLKFGIGTEILNDLEVETDVEKYFDYPRIRLNVGMEYNIKNYFSLRAGYRFLGYEVDSYTLGIGVRYPFGTKLVKVDAAYAPEDFLKNTADMSFGVKFPGVSSEKDWKMANMLYYKGIYYYTNGDLKKAIELWKEVLKYAPDHDKAKQKIKDAQYLDELKNIEKKVKDQYKDLPEYKSPE